MPLGQRELVLFASFADLTLWQLLNRIIACLLLTGLHGFFLALLLRLSGDKTPSYMGRLSPDPFTHLSLIGFLGGVLFKAAWTRPMPIELPVVAERRLFLLGALLGSLVLTLAMVPVISQIRPGIILVMPLLAAQMVLTILDALQDMIISFVVINLIPIPPLSNGLLLDMIRPKWAEVLRKHVLLNELALLALLFIGLVPFLLKPIDQWLRTIVIFG